MALDFPDAPSDGQFYEGFVYSTASGTWRVTKDPAQTQISYLVVGGGGSGGAGGFNGNYQGGGGGAGGYISSVNGESSGSLSNAEMRFLYTPGTYAITVGAGGARAFAGTNNGFNSRFGSIIAIGGGGGGIGTRDSGTPGGAGGSGGGGASRNGGSLPLGGAGFYAQGFAGADGTNNGSGVAGGGGGAGGTGTTATPASGGAGLASSITGSSVTRATGGGTNSIANGAANSGDGGFGSIDNSGGGNGGSGVVIFAVPTGLTVTFSAGVTQSSATVGANTVYTVTATSTTSETVTFA